jgi:ATP-dependent RNA helicase DDX10/DBP4
MQSFVSYLRSIHLHKDKSLFKVTELPIDAFAESLGLAGTPKLKFLNSANKLVKASVLSPESDDDATSSGESNVEVSVPLEKVCQMSDERHPLMPNI